VIDGSQSRAGVSVYSRPDAHYVTILGCTTAGVWVETGRLATVAPGAGEIGLAETVWAAVAPPAEVIPHPSQKEWADWRGSTLAPILRRAQASSWKAFTKSASLVSVYRLGDTCTVSPNRRDRRRLDVFYEITECSVTLNDCSIDTLAPVLRTAMMTAEQSSFNVP
jgi:hypothetical protein